MTHNMIAILDLGSTQSARSRAIIRALGVYSEIHPTTSPPAALKALPGIAGVILNGGENRVVDGAPVEVDPAIYDLGLPILSVDYACCAGHPADLTAWPENTRETLDGFIEGLGIERKLEHGQLHRRSGRAAQRADRLPQGASGAVPRRRGFLGRGGAAFEGRRRSAHLRTRQPRPSAQGRAGAGGARVQAGDGREPHLCGRRGPLP